MQNFKNKSTVLKLAVLLNFLLLLPVSNAISEGVILKPTASIAGMNAQSLLPDDAEYIGMGLYAIPDNGLAAHNDNSHPCDPYLKYKGVFECEADFELRALATPNDPSFNSLWGLNKIGAPTAWNTTTGSDEVVIGVIDTGIDYNHPDLAANMWRNPGEIAGNGIDDDGNGVVDDVFGYNAITGSGDPMDDNSHGTHCAGTIGAVGNNGVGVVGVSHKVKMIGAKFLSASGSGSLSAAIRAINYFTDLKVNRGINIVLTSNSWGGGGYSRFLYDAIKAHEDAGIIFVAAAGNSSNNNDSSASYPASYDLDSIISVAATDSNDNLASFSNYGATSVDIAAPGVGILSTIHNNRYASYSGTSMATPHVSGAIALLKSYANLSMSDLINRVYNTGDTLAQLNGIVATGRRLNVASMISNVGGTPPTPPSNGGDSCSYTATKLDSFVGLTPTQITSLDLIAEEKDEFYESVRFNNPVQFFDEQISSVFVSPNGPIYFSDTSRNDMDYSIDSGVASRSLSAFHTDLISDIYAGQDSQGREVIAFRSVPYTSKNDDYTYVSVILRENGTIDVSFTKPSSADFGNVLMGIKGEDSKSEEQHYKGASATLDDSYSVRYTLDCPNDGDGDNGNSDEDPVVNKLKVKYNKGKLQQRNIRRRASVARLIATHSEQANLSASVTIRGTSCGDVDFNLSNNSKTIFLAPRFRTAVNFKVEGKEVRIKAKSRRRARRVNYLRNTRGIIAHSEKLCNRFISLYNKYNK